MPRPDTSTRALIPTRWLTAGCGLFAFLALLPEPKLAEARETRLRPRTTAVERALTGGLVALRAPGGSMIRIGASRAVFGSTLHEALTAQARCALEPLGHRCRGNTFMNELPKHSQRLPSFWLDRTEVTVADYERCIELGACAPRVLRGGETRLRHGTLPVTLVSAREAETYCRFRGARLPSEAEFERAARGTTGRRYPWGELFNSRLANHGRLARDPFDASDGFEELAPVGSFVSGRTPDGFLDLAGNASEWTSDAYSSQHGLPPEPGQLGERVVKGGNFQTAAAWLRGAARVPLDGSERRPTVGFRCARSAERASRP